MLPKKALIAPLYANYCALTADSVSDSRMLSFDLLCIKGNRLNFIFALLSTSDKVHPQLLAWLLSWKISVFHRTVEGNDVTCSFNLDSWWKRHLDLNYPGRFFLALSCGWKARGDSSLIFLFLPKPLQCVRGGHDVSSVPTYAEHFYIPLYRGTHLTRWRKAAQNVEHEWTFKWFSNANGC